MYNNNSTNGNGKNLKFNTDLVIVIIIVLAYIIALILVCYRDCKCIRKKLKFKKFNKKLSNSVYYEKHILNEVV